MDTNNMIDWNGKLEAVHEDGRVIVTTVQSGPDRDGHYWLADFTGNYPRHGQLCWDPNKKTDYEGWTIRNKPAAAVVPAEYEWGPAIEVRGVRPEWLGDDEQFHAKGGTFDWFGMATNGKPHVWNKDPNREPSWNGVDAIRLPANHPHYKTLQDNMPQNAPKTHRQGTNGVRTSQECLERMEALVRRMAKHRGGTMNADYADAYSIVRDLPEPVDPDIQIARDIIADAYESGDNLDAQHSSDWAGHCRSGAYDDGHIFVATLAAIKRGRALERGEG